MKFITHLTVTDNLKKFGKGLGSASPEGGYAWYAGTDRLVSVRDLTLEPCSPALAAGVPQWLKPLAQALCAGLKACSTLTPGY